MDVQIITPPTADETDALDRGLVTLTEAICQATGEENDYGLGGRFGYGENFENDVFSMRRYYWGECDCGWDAAEAEWSDKHSHSSDYARRWAEFLKEYPGHKSTCSLELPNFLHKRTGLEVRWYKWIGRDMEVKNDEDADLQAIFAECLASLPAAGQEADKR